MEWGYVRVVLVTLLLVVFLIHLLCVLLGGMLSTLAVNKVHSLSLSELVDFTTGDSSKEFLGECVGDWFACVLSSSACIALKS